MAKWYPKRVMKHRARLFLFFFLLSFSKGFAQSRFCEERLAEQANEALSMARLEHPELKLNSELPSVVVSGLIESGYMPAHHLCLEFLPNLVWAVAGESFMASSSADEFLCTPLGKKPWELWRVLESKHPDCQRQRVDILAQCLTSNDPKLVKVGLNVAIQHCTKDLCRHRQMTLPKTWKVPESPEEEAQLNLLSLYLTQELVTPVTIAGLTAMFDLKPPNFVLISLFSKRPDLLESLAPAVQSGYGPHLNRIVDLFIEFSDRPKILDCLFEALTSREEGHFRQFAPKIIQFFAKKTGRDYTGDDRYYRDWFQAQKSK